MGRAAHLLVIFVACLPEFCQARGHFPALKDYAENSLIKASSTCGETETKYCDAKTITQPTCTEKVCKYACCTTCSDVSPNPENLAVNTRTYSEIYDGQPRPTTIQNSLGFNPHRGSHIDVTKLPSVDHETNGFTICVWVNQTSGNQGTILTKSLSTSPSIIYAIVLEDFSVTLYYTPEGSNTTENIKVTPLASQYPADPEEWHFMCVMVVDTDLSYFLDGGYVGTDISLKNSISDTTGRARIGQMYSGAQQYSGLMQDVFFYNRVLTNREVTEVYTGVFPTTYIASECRCPPTHPKISNSLPGRKCVKNSDTSETNLVSRLANTAHPVEFATDDDSWSYWLSEDTNQVTIDVNLMYGQLQVFHIVTKFYGPLPAAIVIERSVNYGKTYQPWQYYAVDCQKSFQLANNGRLSQPDSVNCLQTQSSETDGATISFSPDNPGAKDVPLRPYGRSCTNLYCSQKLLAFIRATNVRIHLYNHTLFPNSVTKYFGLTKLVVTARCECYGNARNARYILGNETNNGTCICECESSTFTEGKKCDRCQPLYNNKPFLRGSTLSLHPCVKCQCNNHAASCYYNHTLDPFPRDRTRGGGGVCINCQHNTAGQHCDSCAQRYYREPGKDLGDSDVCTPCGCTGAGVKPGSQDCVKDNSDAAILAGQCECKDNVTGRLCNQCKLGYYDLNSSHATGCISCNCDVRGTVNGDIACDVTSGQCRCKANVMGIRCDQCKARFYNLTGINSDGCQPCLCNLTGAISQECDKTSGQCRCKNTITGRQCGQCNIGFHNFTSSGCQGCQCSIRGTRFGARDRCDPVSGQCQCKNYVSGYSCDQCKPGYYNLQQLNDNGCTRCQCDTKGTLGVCNDITGVCTCKKNVTGPLCDQCPTGYFNLTSTNPNGCQPCQCYPKGTSGGNLHCGSSTGQCLCLSNVRGLKCDQCVDGYVWDQAGRGCVSCRCDPDGSASSSCNDTGYCTCKTGTGVGGQFCDTCLTGYHSFVAGRCTSCNCNSAGTKADGCDVRGCYCKDNVEGIRCDQCKPGTQSLKQNNPFGCSGVPSQQGPPFVYTSNSTTLRVEWEPPDQPNGLITKYELYRNDTRVYAGLSREFNDTGLKPYSWYKYYIITYTDGGNIRSFDDGKLYRTNEDAPYGVSRPNITDIHPRSAKAVWSYPRAPNGILTSFHLLSTNSRDATTTEHCQGLELSCDVINLRPYTVYNFTIDICTSAGCTQSQPNSILTRPTRPDSQPAPNVVPLPGGESFIITWEKPAEPNGIINLYELYRRRFVSGRPDNSATMVYHSSPSVNPGASDLRNTTDTGLVPFTWYEYRVRTYTAQVSGDTASNWTRQRTAEAVPQGENEILPQAYAISSSEVNITWSLPASPRGIIIKSRVYIYTNETSYTSAVLALTVNRTSSGVVSGLEAYTVYRFTVTSCNSVGCTQHSTKTEVRTLPSAPAGQAPPTGTPLNSSHLTLTWEPPSHPNGPVPPEYHVIRSHAVFYYPPINSVEGAHFPGLGYYKLSNTALPQGLETQIEFWFRTRFLHGLIMFLASNTQDDFLAVELRDGMPWFIFDCQSGTAEISVNDPTTVLPFNDGNWHYVQINRVRRNGDITVDRKYRGQGQSPSGASYIDQNTGVYIGGVEPTLNIQKAKILKNVHSLNYSMNFIGCLKELRLQNKIINLDNAVEKINVEPLMNGCPLDYTRGFYLKGGGYISLNKNVFMPHTIYSISFDFRTFYTSGILMFVHGDVSYLTVSLDSGNVRVIYRTSCCIGNITLSPRRPVCDGTWHSISLSNFGTRLLTISIDGVVNTTSPVADLNAMSELYFGGLPVASNAAQKADSIGLNIDTTFGGCFRNIRTPDSVDFLTDVSSMVNVDLSGCPSNNPVNGTSRTGCYNGTTELVYVGTDQNMVDGDLASFTDYLYRVESKQPGTQGEGKSSWLPIRSGEGAPEFYRAPYEVIPLPGGRSISVAWQPPEIYRGVLRGYIIRAYHVGNSSIHPVEMRIDEITVLNSTLSGLEPYTMYDVRVAAFTNGGTGESPATRNRSLESVPEGVRIPDVQRYPTSLFISWQVPRKPNGIITEYVLTINDTEVYRGLNKTFNLTGLAVYTRHVILLTACTKINCTQGTSTVFYTAEIPPQGVRPPVVIIRGAHSAEVSWSTPEIINGRIRGYQILASAMGHPMITVNATADQRMVDIANLTAGTLYLFRLKAINGGGATLSSPTRRRTLESSPEEIPPPLVRGLDPYSILVTILEPGLPNGNITRYVLYKVNKDRSEFPVMNGTSNDNYTEDGLKPYTLYSFRSKICTAKGCGRSGVGRGYTLEASPNGTISLNVTVINSTSVHAQWSLVNRTNGNVSYNLIVSGEFLTQGSFQVKNDTRTVASVFHPAKEILFMGLLPYSSFLFQINASNTAGYVLSNIVEGRTGQGAPLGLAAPNVTIVNSTAAFITWLPPERDNGVIIYYEIMRVNSGSGDRNIVNVSLQFSLLMTDMEPYTKYEFQVAASTTGGKTWSDITEVRTLQDIPSPVDPPTILQVDSRYVFVQWDEASQPNGIILHYILYRNNTHRTIVAHNITRLRVTGLEPFTIYVFSVAACTVVGCSNSSLSLPVRTLEDVPEGQSSPILSHAVGPSVMIRWTAPTITNGMVSKYEIQRRSEVDQSNITSVATVAANLSTEYTDDTVVPCFRYHYRVIAFTNAGGTPSPWNNITTNEGAPEFVPRPTTRSLNSSAVQVTWSQARSHCSITHYIVHVMENGRNYTGFQANGPFNFIISGLLPYKDYNILIAACTASACRDSAASGVRTQPGLPSNQPAPSAKPVTNTSLEVSWDPPVVPGGRIQNYVLYRRTLDEPLTENFTMTSYVEVYSGITARFEDELLGVFSEQQYKVTVINTHGNTTSPDSRPFRTGPSPPRAGVLLRGLALNHTSVLLNWTVPEVKLLLGYIRSYEVRYKDVEDDIEYTYTSNLPGSERSVVVTPLRPSRNFSFEVVLNNGAGTVSSNEVNVRTLDGAPEGFDRANVRTINSTTIEVTWSPPRTPNGRITAYNIYANSQRVGTTSVLYFNITSLIPYTNYNIQVEVCTVYACIRNDASTARTLPAVPELLDPPMLSPGRRNILVTWDPPRRPNGEILRYILFRRNVTTCPTRPPPVRLCTYIECPLDEQLCGTSCYHPAAKECCDGVLHDRDIAKTCCGNRYLRKQSPTDVCCGGRFYTRTTNYQCCYGNYQLVQAGQVCCQDNRDTIHVGDGNTCCDGIPYYNNTKYCVCGALYNDNSRKCCGGQVVSQVQVCCGDTVSGRVYSEDSQKKCCGNNYVPLSSLCCQSNTGDWKIYNYTSVREREDSNHMCCGMNRISTGLSCCNNRGYNSSIEVCADRDGCGNGTVCDNTFRNTAKCDRCDSSNTCGKTEGYYTPNPPTPPSQDCGTFTQVASGNDTFLHYNDQKLKPFTDYEYYLVVYNTEGNVSSSYSKNNTLMDAPENLLPPIVTVRSARSVGIIFRSPAEPNGIISEYRLIRVDLNTSAQTLVYQGLNLSYEDSGVMPVTGYVYILEVCTTLCSNITSEEIYTRESTPEIIYPPILKALSAYSIEIRWQRPGRPNGVITGYNISRVNNTGHIIKLWQGINMVFVDNSSDIRPYTNYTYIITACTNVGCADGPRGFVTTLEAPPERVHPPDLQIRSSRVIEVNWREPTIPNGQIIWYTLYRDNASICNTTGICQFERPSGGKYRYTDRSLKPHTLYSYVLEASTIAGSTNSSVAHRRTPQSTPEGIPSPTLTPQSSSSILVTWTEPRDPNGIITNYSVLQDTGVEHCAGVNLRFTVTGLQPFTDNNFQIKACTVQGCGIGNRSVAKTLEAAPSGQPVPSLVALSDAVVRVTWRGPQVPNGIILRYEVERRLLTSIPVVVFITTQPFIWQTLNSGLLPYRNYSYRVRAINSAGSTRSAWATVRTGEGAPSGFYLPTIVVFNATSVTASWREPREPNGMITRYELWIRSIDTPGDRALVASSATPEQDVTVSELRPNSNYEFQLAASTVGGTGYSGWALAETLEAPPLGLRLLTARKHSNGRGLTLSWDEPTQPNGRITNYVVYSEGVRVYSGTSRSFSLRQRLQPFTSYTFQLEACTSAGCTKGSIQNITTAEIPPEFLQAPVFTAISSTYVTLEWRPPALPYGLIILYQVFRTDTSFAVHNSSYGNITSYTDNQLQPYTKYGYKIRALNSAGSTESGVANVTTRQAAPELLRTPEIQAVASTEIEISWSPPGKPNGVITSYTLRRNDTVINHWDYAVLQYTDTSVVPDTFYGYWLTVCTGGGCSHSNRTGVKSGEDVPGAVRAPRLTVLSSVAIRIEWQPPVILNGIVIRYELYVGNNGIYNGTEMLYVISNLLPYTLYTFHVRACTKSGCTKGLPSEARTHEAAPQGLEQPKYTIFGPTVLEVNWALPQQPNGVIMYYTLHRNGTMVYNGSELNYKDLDIKPFTYYSYQVTAFNSAGHVSSPVLYTDRTSSGTPENVTKPQLNPLSGTEIEISWSAPSKPNGIITEYWVLYNIIGSTTQTHVNVGSNMSYIAHNLKYYTVYSFRIRACTSYSACAESDVESNRTLEGVPVGQLAPVIPDQTVLARSVLVTWREPTSSNGVILRYILIRTENNGEDSTEVFTGLAFNHSDTTVLPYETYQYRITSVNNAGMATSDWTTITTRSAPPERVPSPRILATTQTTFVVSFDPPSRPNGNINNYVVQVNNQTVSKGTTLERTITDLQPYTEYSLRVLACTAVGCTASQAISGRTDTGEPSKVEESSFGEVTANSIEVIWRPPSKPYGEIERYFVIYKFICSDNCVSKRAVSETTVDVGLNTSYVITNLEPYSMYEIVIRIFNGKYSADSVPVRKRTGPSDPVYILLPTVNNTGETVFIDWSKSFKLNGPLFEYILYENDFLIFRGTSSNSGQLPGRADKEYIYVISATTTVNGEKRTVKSDPFNHEGVISSQKSDESDTWYKTVWFFVVIAVLLILAVFGVVALCLRRTSGDRTVFVRERDPLPVRPKSRSSAASFSSNYTPSEAHFNLGMVDYNHDRSSRASTLIGESKFDQEDSLDWEGYEGNEPYPYSEKYDDEKAWTQDNDVDAFRSTKYQVFPDTRL